MTEKINWMHYDLIDTVWIELKGGDVMSKIINELENIKSRIINIAYDVLNELIKHKHITIEEYQFYKSLINKIIAETNKI